MSNWRVFVVALGAAFVVALLGGLATQIGPWYHALRKPSWQPPDWLFAPVWTLIFGLAAISAALAWESSDDGSDRGRLLALFAVNGLFNVLWSVLFFRLRRPDWALAEVVPLWLSVLVLIVVVLPMSRLGGAALVPYLLWVGFAAFLNFTIVRLNGPFGA